MMARTFDRADVFESAGQTAPSYDADSDKLLRDNNVWTISQEYAIHPRLSLLPAPPGAISRRYRDAVLGGLYRYFDGSAIERFYDQMLRPHAEYESLSMIFALFTEEAVASKLRIRRPVLDELRQKTANDIVSYYDFHAPQNFAQSVEYAYCEQLSGKVPRFLENVRQLLRAIQTAQHITETSDFLLTFRNLIEEQFHFVIDHEKKRAMQRVIQEAMRQEKEASESRQKKTTADADENAVIAEEELVTAAEFARPDLGTDLLAEGRKQDIAKLKEKSRNQSLREIVEERYGSSMLPAARTEQLNRELATGIHEHSELYLTKGIASDPHSDSYHARSLAEETERNLQHFSDHHAVYRRSITRLEHTIRRSIQSDLENSLKRSNSGKLSSEVLWQRLILQEQKIFTREEHDDFGSLQVDVLLDASASQSERVSLIAAQAYIISSALSACHIPHRVTSFQNLFQYTVLQQFRDYADPPSLDRKLFEYSVSGSNRDGLAIKTVSHLLLQRNADHPILIVLSDGKPNDKNSGLFSGDHHKDYRDRAAVEDTAKEVRNARNRGISVLGVFTGNEEDLANEKMIYGNGFAHIRKIERFSDIVGIYLKKEILDILNP